jgi:hypothetical protein
MNNLPESPCVQQLQNKQAETRNRINSHAVTSKHQNGLEKIRFGEMGVQSVAENLDTA